MLASSCISAGTGLLSVASFFRVCYVLLKGHLSVSIRPKYLTFSFKFTMVLFISIFDGGFFNFFESNAAVVLLRFTYYYTISAVCPCLLTFQVQLDVEIAFAKIWHGALIYQHG